MMMIGVLLFVVLVLGGLLVVGLLLVYKFASPKNSNFSALTQNQPGGGTNAQAILDQRYARGEISQEEYENMKREITQ